MDVYVPENINLFKKQTLNNGILKQNIEIIDPVTNLQTNSDLISFKYDTHNEDKYINLAETELEMSVQITKADGSVITSDTGNYGVITNLSNSLIDNLEIAVNGKIIDQVSMYPYVAFYQTMFNLADKSAKDKEISQLFVKDSANFQTTEAVVTNLGDVNAALLTRYNYVKNSKICMMRSKLYSNLTSTNHLLLPGVELNIKLRKNSDAFCLMSKDKDLKINIVSAKLRLSTVELSKDLYHAHMDVLNKTNANYSFQEINLQTFVLNKDRREFDLTNVYSNEQDAVLFFFVETDAATGSMILNPFQFVHEKLKEITIKQDDKIYTYQLDFEKKNALSAYMTLKKHYPHVDLTYENFVNGYSFILFELRPRGEFKNIERRSRVDVHIEFSEHLSKNITLFALSENAKEFQIDKHMNVIV